jgi:lipopolysaccharide export system permease protein
VKQGDDRREGANVLRLLGVQSSVQGNDSGTEFSLGQRARELHARLAEPISLVLMALVAIPLAFVNPRAGRSWNLIFAILIFFIYYNLLSTAERMVESGKLSPYLGLFPVHGLMVVLVLGMFAYRLLSLKVMVRGK